MKLNLKIFSFLRKIRSSEESARIIKLSSKLFKRSLKHGNSYNKTTLRYHIFETKRPKNKNKKIFHQSEKQPKINILK